ncbi:MAG: sugar hydrolase [Planctomycetota bacterium]|jgi:alpha-L-rhamnosidase|nr:sugar hydrolase [Planctomycetota bacterium]
MLQAFVAPEVRAHFLEQASALAVPLHTWSVAARAQVSLQRDPDVWQSWRALAIGPAVGLELQPGDSLILDFGEHLVGELCWQASAGCRLRLEPAEVIAELGDSWDEFPAVFGDGSQPERRWSPHELNAEAGAGRQRHRHTLRYLRVTLLASAAEVVRFDDWQVLACSTAPEAVLPPLPVMSPRDAAIDRICQLTLRNCLQDVSEDGPKRDRRLWLGDLRLQALLDAHTFESHDLVRRCLYLHAGCTDESGLVPPCVFMYPEPHFRATPIPDYAALFGPTLADYHRASGDDAAARELLPVAVRQCELLAAYLDTDGVWRDPGDLWLFIDWCNELNRETAEHATLAYACGQVAELATRLGEVDMAQGLQRRRADLITAALRHLRDDASGLFVSGPERQVSVASQVWMILAGVVSPAEGAELLRQTLGQDGVVQPGCPYLEHHLLEALLICDQAESARARLELIWGGMLDHGADTFWEVFDPSDPHRSPYHSHLFNSYCHAWSCTPAWFLRHPTYGPLLLER